MVYNFFQKKELQHNEEYYKKIGLHKKYYSSISSKDFEKIDESILSTTWNNKSLEESSLFNALSFENQQSLLAFEENGFAIIKGFVSNEAVNQVNADIELGLKAGTLHFVERNKIMFALHKFKSIANIGLQDNLQELLSILLKGKAVLFQSINFLMGSEQDTHSDSIHMTTFPLGGLLGLWVALEDIDEDNGPLHYYPGSHKLPYYLNKDYDNEGTKFKVGEKSYEAYEAFIEQKMIESKLPRLTFTAKKGDVLIWHANLFHGGNAHTNKAKSRKSMVFHYFKEGSICYHEITQRPAIIKAC